MERLIEIRNLSVGYPNKPNVLTNVSLDCYTNDFLGIIGPNGGGKTTLIKSILNIVKPTKGSVSFFKAGERVESLNIGYLPQMNLIDKKFPISVFDVILSGLTMKRKLLTSSFTKAQKEQAVETATQMGVSDLLDKPIGELSGGQLQRTLLGRAIVDNPELLILDEPSSYVDKRFETDFYQILEEINSRSAIIMVSHDIGTVLSIVKNIACVNRGLHYHSGTDITPKWLENSYSSCPIEIIGHGDFPHRVLGKHNGCECCKKED